jgi:hypothetical protein
VTDHAATAWDQLQLAHHQLRLLDDTTETVQQQVLLFIAAAVVHALTAHLEQGV